MANDNIAQRGLLADAEQQWIDDATESYVASLRRGDADPLMILKTAPADSLVPLIEALLHTEISLTEDVAVLPVRWQAVHLDPLLGPVLSVVWSGLQHIERYRLESLLGTGNFGTVWRAFDRVLKRHVAIKVIKGPSAEIGQLHTEAIHLASLQHPGILPVLTTICPDPEQLWIVTRYVPFGTLDDLLQRERVSTDRSLKLMIGVTEALASMHARQIYHRDLKPSNILIDDNDGILLADFGLSITVANRHRGAGAGTLCYQAPEQLDRSDSGIDGRADLWSVGVILYKLLTGDLPFFAADSEQILQQIQYSDPRPMEETGSSVPSRLQKVCLKLLQREPSKRFQSAQELSRSLRMEALILRFSSSSGAVALIALLLLITASSLFFRGGLNDTAVVTKAATKDPVIKYLTLEDPRNMPEDGPVVFPTAGTTEYRKELIVNGEAPVGNPLQDVGPLEGTDGLRLYGEFYEPAQWLFFVQDPSGAIFVLKSGYSADFRTDDGYLPFPTPPFGNHVIWLATSEKQLPEYGSLQADLQKCGKAVGSLADIHLGALRGVPGKAREAATWPFEEYRKRLQQMLGEDIRLLFPVPFMTVPAGK